MASSETPDSPPSIPTCHKRKRDESAQTVLDDLEHRKSGRMSPDSRSIAESLAESAQKWHNGEEVDHKTLLTGWKAFAKAHDRTTELENTHNDITEKKRRIEVVEGQLEAIRRKQNDDTFLFHFGDHVASHVKWLQSLEAAARELEKPIMKARYEEKGLAPTPAYDAALEDIKWSAMSGRMTTDIHRDVERESDLVNRWRARGKLEDEAPSTPYLDRIALICQCGEIPREKALQWIKCYSDRNELAHHAPPRIEDMLRPGGWDASSPSSSVDWPQIKTAYSKCETQVERKYEAGVYTEDQRNMFIESLQRSWALLCTEDDSGNLTPTPEAIKICRVLYRNHNETARKELNNPTRPPADYPSPYEEGKWDDIL